jgi:hypothetical protein
MYIKILTNISITLFFLLFTFANSIAKDSCDNYPMSAGEIAFEETPTGPKIMATGFASVYFDDADEVLDATSEATLMAKAVIAKFFNETIQSEESLETAAMTSIKIVKGAGGDTEQATKEKVKVSLKKMSSESKALLRGVVKLAECYTKGDRVLVTVGLKPETIAAATGLKNQTSGDNSSAENSKEEEKALTEGPESHSKGKKKLDDF